jgi:hypothetical protein
MLLLPQFIDHTTHDLYVFVEGKPSIIASQTISYIILKKFFNLYEHFLICSCLYVEMDVKNHPSTEVFWNVNIF